MLSRNCLPILVFCLSAGFKCEKGPSFLPGGYLSVAFYNLDNLYDTVDDKDHNDTEFTPSGKYAWTVERYSQKLDNMRKVIVTMANGNSPDVLGMCELESRQAINDLFSAGMLKGGSYDIVHYDSPDERGIDVALAYNKKKLSVIDSKKVHVKLLGDTSDRTRDILWVRALASATSDTIDFIVCHFPSRREGKDKSEPDRLDAAQACIDIAREKCNFSKQNLVIMGDFNDEPWDKSISSVIGAVDAGKDDHSDLQNLMWQFRDEGKGTYRYRDQWNILDQFIVSRALNDSAGAEYVRGSVNIVSHDWMIQKGKYKGFPLRTFGGDRWLNGYSDHFPICMTIKLR